MTTTAASQRRGRGGVVTTRIVVDLRHGGNAVGGLFVREQASLRTRKHCDTHTHYTCTWPLGNHAQPKDRTKC
jgi:hypothetical protein